VAAEPRKSSIQEIKNKGAENEPDRFVETICGEIGVCTLQKSAFQDFKRGCEPTKQIPCRH
jgi:hypothetical protein